MALRGRIPDNEATFPDPVFGVNLHNSPEDLNRGESPLMQNAILEAGLQTRLGSDRLTAAQLAASFRVAGGHKFYAQSGVGFRLIAYDTKIALVADAGTQTLLSSSQTSDKDTYFTTWSILDKVYIANGVDELAEYNGTTFQVVSAIGGSSQVPGDAGFDAPVQVLPILDRLMVITANGLERTDARVAHIWSFDSSWATLRPSLSGPFVGGVTHSLVGTDGTVQGGLLVMQNNAYYWVTGTDFGLDVTAASPTATENAVIRLIDSAVGAIGPRSIATVPGVGVFWLTSDLDIYHVPVGQATGVKIGLRIRSTGTTNGLNNMNISRTNRAFLVYHGRYLRVGFPVGSDAFPTIQYWLDIDKFRLDPRLPVWYGPMTGQSHSATWTENQGAENQLIAAEGNQATGVFVYTLDVGNTYKDAVGSANNNVAFEYHTYYKTFGAPSREKLIAEIEFELNAYTGDATVSLADLSGTVSSDIPIEKVRL